MDKDVVHLYNGILVIKKNRFESVLLRFVNLEPINTERSKKEKNILMHIYGIQKNGIDEPICREGMETQMQRMDLWTQGGQRGQMEKVALTQHCKNFKNK